MQHTRIRRPSQSNPLARHPRLPTWFRVAAGLALLVGVTLADTPTGSAPERLQAQRLEVLNEAGQIVFMVHATKSGGRLEVKNEAGMVVFSAGTDPDDPVRVEVWEQTRPELASLRRDLTRQRQQLHDVTRQLREVERQSQQLQRTLHRRDTGMLHRQDLEQHHRELEALERQVRKLSRQVGTWERR